MANDHCVGTFAKDVRISEEFKVAFVRGGLFSLLIAKMSSICLRVVPQPVCLQIQPSDFPANGCIVLEVKSADGRSQETPFLRVRLSPSHISTGTTPATTLFFPLRLQIKDGNIQDVGEDNLCGSTALSYLHSLTRPKHV